jgi:hypothetical protein
MSDVATIFLTVASTAVGSAASWFISRWYYRRSGTDLDTALRPLVGNNQKPLQAVNAIGRILEQNGQGTLAYDEAGKITGVVVKASASDVAIASDCAMVTIKKVPLPQYDRLHEQPPAPETEGNHA